MKTKEIRRILLSSLCCLLSIVMIAISAPSVFADEDGSSKGKTEEEYREEISNLQDEQIKIQE